MAEAIRKSEEEAKQKEDERKERNRQKVAQRLPKEPDLNAEKTARIRFRVVGGETTESKTFERRFLASDTLQTIFDYLTVEGFAAPEDYKVISSWPRRDVSKHCTFACYLRYRLTCCITSTAIKFRRHNSNFRGSKALPSGDPHA